MKTNAHSVELSCKSTLLRTRDAHKVHRCWHCSPRWAFRMKSSSVTDDFCRARRHGLAHAARRTVTARQLPTGEAKHRFAGRVFVVEADGAGVLWCRVNRLDQLHLALGQQHYSWWLCVDQHRHLVICPRGITGLNDTTNSVEHRLLLEVLERNAIPWRWTPCLRKGTCGARTW